MSGRFLIRAIELALAAQLVATSLAQGGDYRGATSGWPSYSNGYYAANYPANYGTGAAYYVARPVTTGAYAASPGVVRYVPVQAAYANPTYYAAYGRSPSVYRPVSTAGYAPTTAYYAPVTANYAPSNSYAVSPAGLSSAGSEAATYYGQPTNVNYVPPQFNYRTNYAPVPVYMYRPVTAYDPITAQPTTCLQASTCNTCQPQRSSGFSLLNPFTWFGHSSSSCGSRGCGTSSCAPPPSCTTNYCGSACGQPYYPAQPMTPVVPVYPTQPPPANVIPAMPRGFIPSGSPTIPPPPTVAPNTRTIVSPADTVPSLSPRPGTTFGAPSGGTIVPGTAIPVQPTTPGFSTPIPSGSFPTTPAPPSSGSFGTGTNYAPAVDPYTAPLTPAERTNSSGNNSNSSSTGANVIGSGYRAAGTLQAEAEVSEPGIIRAPDASRALPPSVKTVPDLDSTTAPRPINAAPKLIDPQDKTARLGNRWAAVPAKWPEKHSTSKQLHDRPVTPLKAYQAQTIATPMNSPYQKSPTINPADYDDKGWKTASGY